MTIVFALVGTALCVALLALHWRLARATVRPSPPRRRARSDPPLTIVRPIKELDPGAGGNLASLFELDWSAHVQVLLVLDDARDPAFTLAWEVAASRREEGADVEVLLCGAPPPGRTGKLHAMLAGLAAATGEFVAFSDSDTRPTRHLLRSLADALEDDPRAGDAFAPVVATWHDEPTAGDVGAALLLNAWYGPSAALAAGPGNELPFIMGQLMLFPRSTFDAIGGLASADGQFVDDMWLGRRVAEAGLRNVQVRDPLPLVVGGMRFGAFLRLFRRWLLFAEGGLPASFTRPHWWRGTLYGIAVALAVAALARGSLAASVAPLVAAGTFVWSTLALQRRHGGPPIPLRHLWGAAILPVLGGGVLLSTLVSRTVDWRGRSYRLDGHGRLAADTAPPRATGDLLAGARSRPRMP